MRWPNQPAHFLAIGQENQGWSQFDVEGPAQRPATAVLHLEVPDGGVGGQRLGDD